MVQPFGSYSIPPHTIPSYNESELDVTDYPMVSMRPVMDMHLDLMKNFKESKFIGINLLTFKLSDEEAKKEIDKVKMSMLWQQLTWSDMVVTNLSKPSRTYYDQENIFLFYFIFCFMCTYPK